MDELFNMLENKQEAHENELQDGHATVNGNSKHGKDGGHKDKAQSQAESAYKAPHDASSLSPTKGTGRSGKPCLR